MMSDISRKTKVEVLTGGALLSARTADSKAKEAADVTSQNEIDPRAASAFNVVDILGFESVMFTVWAATGLDTMTFAIKHGDVAGALSDASSECIVSVAGKTGDKTRNVGYIGGKRYVQLVCSATANGVAIMQRPNAAPIN